MFIKSIITGSVITAILIVVLSSSRLFQTAVAEKDAILTEVETVYLDPPPEPDLEEEEEEEELEPEEIETASIPAMELMVSDLEMPALPESQTKFDPNLVNVSIEIPELERAPSALPVKPKPVAKPKAKPSYKPKVKSKPRPKAKPKSKPRPKPQPRPKAYYGAGELDRLPREIRVGRFSWPSRARGTGGTVKFLLEINTSGRVSVVSVISSTDPQLTIAAKRVATGSKFTAPTKGGRPVKARFTKTYQLKKPR